MIESHGNLDTGRRRLGWLVINKNFVSMQQYVLVFITALSTIFSQSAGELLMKPRSTETMIGETTYFNCSTSFQDRTIFWFHGNRYVYTTVGILDPYRERFTVDWNDSTGSHNLVIHSVEAGDAGEYICVDDDGLGARRSAKLIVLEENLVCMSNIQPDGVIGRNSCGIEPDEIQLSCSIKFYGNAEPIVEWRNSRSNHSISKGVSSYWTNNDLNYTLMVDGAFNFTLNNSSFICQTTRTVGRQHSCSSEVIKVLNVFSGNATVNISMDEEVTCTASSSQPCTYKWKWQSGDDSVTMSNSQTLTPTRAGLHRCEATCVLRAMPCTVIVMFAEVTDSTTHARILERTAAPVVVPIVVIILVVLISVYVLRNNKRTKNKKIQRQIHEIKSEVQKIEWLTTMNSIHNIDEELSAKDHKVAAEEIELLYKIKTQETSEGKAILGSAILDGELFLVLEESSILEAYKCNDFNSRCRLLKVEEVTAALDICSCKKNKCLYIMNMNNFTMKVVKISTTGDVLFKWSTKDNARGFLSATTEGNLIISVQDRHMLLEYSPDGKLERKIKLEKGIKPWHAIKLETDFYIVSHGTLFDPLHRVCRVDKKGKVHESFGGKIGSAANQLNMPVYLAVGSEGCVVVADLCNHRVLLLDSSLEFKKTLVPKYKQRFRSPRRICMDEGLLVLVVGLGIPQKEIRVEPDTWKETESFHSSMKTAYGGAKFYNKERKEVVEFLESDDPKEAGDTVAEEEENDILAGNYCPQENSQLVAKDSLNKNGEDDEIEAVWGSLDNFLNAWKKNMKEVDVQKRIEEDCRLLVFDMNPLLQSG